MSLTVPLTRKGGSLTVTTTWRPMKSLVMVHVGPLKGRDCAGELLSTGRLDGPAEGVMLRRNQVRGDGAGDGVCVWVVEAGGRGWVGRGKLEMAQRQRVDLGHGR